MWLLSAWLAAHAGKREVRCPLAADAPLPGSARITLDLGAGRQLGLDGVEIRDGVLRFRDDDPASQHRGTLVVAGFAPAELGWERGECATVRLERAATITGKVRPAPEPDAAGTVSGCGGAAVVGADGTFALEVVPDRCDLVARREDGWYEVRSEPVAVAPRPGEQLRVDLALPVAKQAGLGVLVEPVEGGLVITRVRRGSAAANAGLRPGDLIVALDGAPVADPGVFAARSVGDVGSSVVADVRVAGRREQRTLTRAFVPSEYQLVEQDGASRLAPRPDAWVE